MKKLIILATTLALALPVLAKQNDKGHGPGGQRSEYADEMGMEKGKAWAGEQEDGLENKLRERDHEAGEVREEHASEMGMEKGEAWAGEKEKKERLEKSHEKKQKNKKEK